MARGDREITVGWKHSEESFVLSSGSPEWWGKVARQREVPALLPVLEGRLFLASMKGTPVAQPAEYYVTLNKKLRCVRERDVWTHVNTHTNTHTLTGTNAHTRYVPFCADFGPFNLGTTHHVCHILKVLLSNEDKP